MGKATSIEEGEAIVAMKEDGLIEGEKIMHAFKLAARDLLILSDKRIIRVQNYTIMSEPWKNVRSWSFKEAGTLDADSELYLHLVHKEEPLTVEFARTVNIALVSANIGAAITGSPVKRPAPANIE